MREPGISISSLIGYGYVLLAMAICYLMPLPDTVKSIIAQPGLIIIPYLVGKPILFLTRKLQSIEENYDFPIELLITWSLGIIVIVTIEAILHVSYIFSLDLLISLLLVLGIPSTFIRGKSSLLSLRQKELAIAAIYGLFFSFFITSFWKYPFANDTDYITHTFNVTSIVTQNRPLIFHIDYLPTMHTLYAILMKLFTISSFNEPVFLLWSSRFILYPIYSVGLYLFAYQFSKNKIMALFVAFIGSSLINPIDGTLFPYHTAPENYIDILIIYGLYIAGYLYEKHEGEIRHFIPSLLRLVALLLLILFPIYIIRRNGAFGYEIGWILPVVLLLILTTPRLDIQRSLFLSLSIFITGLMFIHKLQGLQAGGIILIFIFFRWCLSKISLDKARLMAGVFFSLPVIAFILFQFKIIPYPSEGIISLYLQRSYLFGWGDLTKYIMAIYPSVLLFLLAAGCIFPLFSQKENEKKFLSPVIMTSIILLAYFMPISHFYRFLGDAHPFIILLCVLAVFWLLQIGRFSLKEKPILLSLILLVSFIGMSVFTNDVKAFSEGTVNIKEVDYRIFEVGSYLQKYIKKDGLAICYAWYDRLAAYYGGINVITPWEDDVFNESYINEIYLAKTARESYDKAMALSERQDFQISDADSDDKDLDRFFKLPSELILLYNEPLSLNLKGTGSVTKFFDSRYFELLFTTRNENKQNFYIFRLKPEPASGSFENLVKNPSFEEKQDDTTTVPVNWQEDNPLWKRSLDGSQKFDGEYSYKMETASVQEMFWGGLTSDEIDVIPGKSYLLEGAIKTENAKQSLLKLWCFDKTKGDYVSIDFITGFQDTQNWESRSKFVAIPDGVDKVRIILMAGWVGDKAKGNAITWFDNIQLIGPIQTGPPK